MDTKPQLFVAAKGFISRDGKVLIIRESTVHRTNSQVGKFDVVGGRLTPGETIEECLRREVQEEVGLTVTVGKPFFVNESRNTVHGEHWQIIRIFFDCRCDARQITLNEEHDTFLWIDPANYRTENVIENLYPAFEAYLHR